MKKIVAVMMVAMMMVAATGCGAIGKTLNIETSTGTMRFENPQTNESDWVQLDRD